MSYSPEVYSRVQKLYEERRSRALTDLEGRIGQAKEQVPDLRRWRRCLVPPGCG